MTASSQRPTLRRNRVAESSEQTRAERRRLGLCRDCPRKSKTVLCAICNARIEAATDRYVGQSRRGRMARWQEDLGELVRAMDAITNAHKAIAAIGERTDLTARERQHMLVEPLAQVNLGRRFLIEVLRRNGEAPDADEQDADSAERGSSRPRDPNYAIRVEARRLAGLCDRCDCERVPGRRLCRKHLRKQRAANRRAWARRQEQRSNQGPHQAPTTTKFRTGSARGTEDRPRRRSS